MVGLATEYTIDLSAASGLRNLTPDQMETVMFAIGELMVTQTKTRIADEKRGPDGEAWAPWSPAYAATRSGGHSLLQGEDHLLDSIANHSEGLRAIVGTNLVYAAIQQFGGDPEASHAPIPARPYFGLSGENVREIEDLLAEDLSEMLQ